MNRVLRHWFFIVPVWSMFFAIQTQAENQTRFKKQWTILVYMAADNNLAPYALRDRQELEALAPCTYANVLVCEHSHRPGHDKVTSYFEIQKNKSIEHVRIAGRDSGSANVLVDACGWALEYYPAEHFALVLWDHGCSWRHQNYRGVCFDDTTGHCLSDQDLRTACRRISSYYLDGKKIDILAFDACLMANLEIALAVQPYVSYMVGSQEVISANGFAYCESFKSLRNNPVDAEALTRAIVRAYGNFYKYSGSTYTLSAFSLNDMDRLGKMMIDIAKRLTKLLKSGTKENAKKVIKACSTTPMCPVFDDGKSVDIYHFLQNLLNSISQFKLYGDDVEKELTILLTRAIKLLEELMIMRVCDGTALQPHGLSIYFPQSDFEDGYEDVYWLSSQTWALLIKTYLRA